MSPSLVESEALFGSFDVVALSGSSQGEALVEVPVQEEGDLFVRRGRPEKTVQKAVYSGRFRGKLGLKGIAMHLQRIIGSS